MKTIWKFRLPQVGLIELPMPEGAVVRKLGLQEVSPKYFDAFVWAEVDDEADMETRQFYLVATGAELPSCEAGCSGKWHYFDTLFLLNGLVFHLYQHLIKPEHNQ